MISDAVLICKFLHLLIRLRAVISQAVEDDGLDSAHGHFAVACRTFCTKAPHVITGFRTDLSDCCPTIGSGDKFTCAVEMLAHKAAFNISDAWLRLPRP
jgi:hypothetical protein